MGKCVGGFEDLRNLILDNLIIVETTIIGREDVSR